MLILSIVFLVGMYVLKIFFPQEFMMTIQNENIISIGTFIDNHKWLYYICCGITAFITYYLYCCACSGRLRLRWYEVIEIILVIAIVRVVSFYDNTLATSIQLASFIFLPAMVKGSLRNTSITYTIHLLAQSLSLGIRNLPLYLASNNFVTVTLLAIDMYFWLLLLYIIFNYKKKEE